MAWSTYYLHMGCGYQGERDNSYLQSMGKTVRLSFEFLRKEPSLESEVYLGWFMILFHASLRYIEDLPSYLFVSLTSPGLS